MSALRWARLGPHWPHRDCSAFVPAGGVRFHVQRMGTGPRALLLHGAGAASHSMGPLASLLRDRFSLVVPDLPGHGFSDAEGRFVPSVRGMERALAALLPAVGNAPVELLVGHSAGAAVAIQMVLRGSVRPRLLVLLAPAVAPLEGALGVASRGLARALAVWPPSSVAIAGQAAEPGAVERLLARMGSHLREEGLALYRGLARDSHHVEGVLRMLAVWDPSEVSMRLPTVRTPVLVVAGEKDHAIRLPQVRQATARIPGAALRIVEQAGHLLHEEQPRRVAEHIFTAWDALGQGPTVNRG